MLGTLWDVVGHCFGFCIEEVVAGLSPVQGSLSALGVLCCFALFVCLTLLASFFLPSHLSFKHVCIQVCIIIYMYIHMHVHVSGCGGRGSWSDTERTGGRDSAEVSGHHPVIVVHVATIPWSRSRSCGYEHCHFHENVVYLSLFSSSGKTWHYLCHQHRRRREGGRRSGRRRGRGRRRRPRASTST